MLSPSSLRPHCLARDRLRLWLPTASRLHNCTSDPSTASTDHIPFSDEDRERITDVLNHAWEEDTRETYGSGLLVYHVFCDAKQVPEHKRAPASQLLLSAFVSSLAASYAGKTISNYFYGVRAWHVLHGIPWRLEKAEMDAMLRAAEKLTPTTSKRKPRRPYTPDFMIALRRHLDLNDPLDAAVFACLTTCFYASARVGEFAVRRLEGFDSEKSVTRKHLTFDHDRNGLKVTTLHVPKTKNSAEGEDVFWAKQNDLTDPEEALRNHLRINDPPENQHLFAYRYKSSRRPLTKSKFVERLAKAARTAGLDPLQGHGIRIGSTLEYLLRGMPFDVMKAKGRWASDAFLVYLRKHALIMAPYIQAVPAIHEAFIRYTMPPVR
ncbi:DNA breaking-rejoining enzyme [Flammula alnicola]|nr:DNA breaking-rejoining enzyme [Flammula alnicola]KAF8953933.1 DNA breaking-rejoining enzyme [Flammula alnicola]